MMSNISYKEKNVLVTGADGFIGYHLSEELVRKGANVTALAQYNSFGSNGWLDKVDQSIRGDLTIKRGDIRDAGCVNAIVEKQEIVFHLAALIAIPFSYEAPQSYIDVNVSGTLNVLEAARRFGVERVVQTSTSEVYGSAEFTPITEDHPLHGQSPYSASKIAADMMCEAYVRSFELPLVIIRPFNTYGPRQSERAVIPTVIRQALDPDCDIIKLGDLTPKRDFNYVGDTVDGFLRAGCANNLDFGVPYNVGSGVAVTIGEMVECVNSICGANKPVHQDDARARPAKSEVLELLACPKQFIDKTGWESKVDLELGLSHTIEWWRSIIQAGETRYDSDYLI